MLAYACRKSYFQTWAEHGGCSASRLSSRPCWWGYALGTIIRGRHGRAEGNDLWRGLGFAALSIHGLVDADPSTPGAVALWPVLGLISHARQFWSSSPVADAQEGGRGLENAAKTSPLGASSDSTQRVGIPRLWGWLGLSMLLTLACLPVIASSSLPRVALATRASLASANACLAGSRASAITRHSDARSAKGLTGTNGFSFS